MGSPSKGDLFGQIAVAKGLLTAGQIEEALRLQRESAASGAKKRIGEICVERGYLTGEQMEEVLYEQVIKYIESQQPAGPARGTVIAAAMASAYPTVKIPAEASEPVRVVGSGPARKAGAVQVSAGKKAPAGAGPKGPDAGKRAAAGGKADIRALLPKGCLGRVLLAAAVMAAVAWGLVAARGLY